MYYRSQETRDRGCCQRMLKEYIDFHVFVGAGMGLAGAYGCYYDPSYINSGVNLLLRSVGIGGSLILPKGLAGFVGFISSQLASVLLFGYLKLVQGIFWIILVILAWICSKTCCRERE